MHTIKDIIQELTYLSAPSGYEGGITSFLKNILSKYSELEVTTDHIGNLIVTKKGIIDDTIMLVAHCDEIGLVIKYISDSGFIHFTTIGGIETQLLKGRSVIIMHHGKMIPGVIGVRPLALSKKTNQSKDIDLSDLWIDIGVSNKSEAEELVSVGDPITFQPNYFEFNNKFFTNKSLDNRVGVAILLALIDKLHNEQVGHNISFVFSVQEEVGMRGIIAAGYSIHPIVGIAIDVTHATDYPTINKVSAGDIKLGKGPVIPIGPNFTGFLQEQFRNIASNNNIKYQIESISGRSGTDLAELQLLRGGCHSGLICVPCRYMHSPVEMASLEDIVSAIEILYHYCLEL